GELAAREPHDERAHGLGVVGVIRAGTASRRQRGHHPSRELRRAVTRHVARGYLPFLPDLPAGFCAGALGWSLDGFWSFWSFWSFGSSPPLGSFFSAGAFGVSGAGGASFDVLGVLPPAHAK